MNTLGFGIVNSAVLILAALGFTLQFSVTNYVNFAYGGYLSLGALLAVVFNNGAFHLGIVQSAVMAAVGTSVVAVVTNRVLLGPFSRRRTHPVYLLVVTFGLSQLMDSVFQLIWGTNTFELNFGGSVVRHVGPFLWSTNDIDFIAVAAVGLLLLQAVLKWTRLGRYMRAIADDESLAKACGIPEKLVIDATWAISGALAGLAGVFFAMEAFAFTTTLGDTYIFIVFGAVILGGIGRPLGAVTGAIIVGIAIQMGQYILPASLAPLLVFGAIILIMVARPDGLFSRRVAVPSQS